MVILAMIHEQIKEQMKRTIGGGVHFTAMFAVQLFIVLSARLIACQLLLSQMIFFGYWQ